MIENKVSSFLKSDDKFHRLFQVACLEVPPPWGKKSPEKISDPPKGIPATKRQASKWLRNKGIAYKVRMGIA